MNIKLIKKFKNYVRNYDLMEDAINRKLKHSIRVMRISESLAKRYDMTKDDICLARVIGILHDYARFEQWTKYNTYSDLESIDHGDLAIEKLFDNNEIVEFYSNKNNYEIAKLAIKYHNKLNIPDDLDERTKIHCELIRDADKIDIFHIFANLIIKISEDDKNISKNVEKEFFLNKCIKRKDIKNESDELLLILSMIYDLNFKSSLEYISKKNYVWKIYETLNNKEKYKKYFEYIDNYIKERIN